MYTSEVYSHRRHDSSRRACAATPKQLRTVPPFIATKLAAWVEAVEATGLEAVRRVPGFHDEPLKGPRAGQRSIRLSRAYRAIDVIHEGEGQNKVEFVRVEEVHKHDY